MTTNNPTRFWRARLKRLCREKRFGNDFLPDNDEGRSILIALLCLGGLPDAVAIEFAWWCEAELPALKSQARRIKWCDVGKIIGMTTQELEEYKLWSFGLPADQTPEEFKTWKKDRSKRLARERQQKRREILKAEKERKMEMAKAERNPRDATIRKVLVEHGHPMRVPEIMQAVRRLYDFKNLSSESSLRTAVHKSVKRLEKNGAVITAKQPGRTGEKWVFIPTKVTIPLYPPEKPVKSNKINGLIENRPCHAACRVRERDALPGTGSDDIQSLPSPRTDQTKRIAVSGYRWFQTSEQQHAEVAVHGIRQWHLCRHGRTWSVRYQDR
jgi:hypothetical protein